MRGVTHRAKRMGHPVRIELTNNVSLKTQCFLGLK